MSVMSQQQQQSKILKTTVKVLGKFLLEEKDRLDVSKAQQLLHAARADRLQVRSTLRLLSNGFQLGDTGVFANLPAEFVSYSSIDSFVSLHEDKRNLALCWSRHRERCVTVLRFRDVEALDKVCAIINRQRAILLRNGSVDNSSGTAAGSSLFDKRPIIREITQPEPHTFVKKQHDANEEEEALDSNVVFSSDSVDGSNNGVIADKVWHTELQQQRQQRSYVDEEEEDPGSEWDDLEAFAVFESADGPPTLLNESTPVRHREKIHNPAFTNLS